MSVAAPLKITGTKETIAALDMLQKSVAKKILRKGLRAGGKIVQKACIAEAPEKSGLTARKIKVRAGKAAKGKIRVAVGLSAKDFTGKAFYEAFLIYGHKSGHRKPKGIAKRISRALLGDRRHKVEGNNFLARGLESSGDAAMATAAEVWGQEIDKACANKGNAND